MYKKVMQAVRPQYKIIDEATDIIVIVFITCISTSDDAYHPKLGTRKAKAME